MIKQSNNMKKSKSVDKHDPEKCVRAKKSTSILPEDEVITGINLRQCFNESFATFSKNEKSMRKKSSSRSTFRTQTYDSKPNLKTPIVLEDDSSTSSEEGICVLNPNGSSCDFTPESSSDVETRDSENMECDIGPPSPEFQNLESQNEKSPQFYCLKNKVLVLMKPETIFWFCGKLKVQVLYGSIKIYGAELSNLETAVPVEVYSPRNHSLVGIETGSGPSKSSTKKLWKKLVAEGLNQDVESSMVSTINQIQVGSAIVLLENLTNHLTNFLSTYCSFKLFPKIEDQTFYSWKDPKRAEAILQANFRYHKTGKLMTMDPQWKTQVVDKISDEYSSEQQSINLIFGGKSVGKSTFSRYLVNSVLPKSRTVVFINLDPGQTECTPAGCISMNLIDKPLLGPNFTQLRMPYYQLYIGDVNVSNCITRYLEGVKKIADCLKNDPKISRLPVIVNTMGFCKGIGWDIAVSIIRLFQPTNVIQITSKKPKTNFDNCLSRDIVARQNSSWIVHDEADNKQDELSYTLHQLNSKAEIHSTGDFITWNMEPYQKRDLVMLAYLSQITDHNGSISSFKCSTPKINDAVPYKVPLSSLYLSLTQTGVPLTHILAAMNGNIVALCGFDPTESAVSTIHTKPENPQVLVRTPLCTCYGFGVIRGIDIEQKYIYINTPLTIEVLRFVNCLVDCVPIPTALLPLNLPNAPYTGNKADLPTSKEPRRGYFRMRNQTT